MLLPVGADSARAGPVADTLAFESLDGAILVSAHVSGPARDTSGSFILDTGAGYLALDRPVARAIGALRPGHASPGQIEILPAPIPRLTLGSREYDQLTPALAVDLHALRDATDRVVLGLLGTALFSRGAIVLDDSAHVLVAVAGGDVPPDGDATERSRSWLAPWLGPRAVGAPFRLMGDGKLVVRGRVAGVRDTLTWVLDTGATKTALFERALRDAGADPSRWRTLRGLVSPTLYGNAPVRFTRLAAISVDGASAAGVDAVLLDGRVANALERSIGERVHGLLGASFLRRFRVAVDFAHERVWFEPRRVGRDERPHEYCTVGVQLERRGARVRVSAVAIPSPARQHGVHVGDALVALDGRGVRGRSILALTRALEGPPGSVVRLTLERSGAIRHVRLVRRPLL